MRPGHNPKVSHHFDRLRSEQLTSVVAIHIMPAMGICLAANTPNGVETSDNGSC